MLNRFNNWYKSYKRSRSTRRELERLTDKELADIGISRGDIGRIANDMR